jgi:hypothetical protein
MHAFALVTLLVSSVLAAPLARRNCRVMPSSVDPNMRDTIYKVVMGLKDTDNVKQSGGVDRVLLVTMVTAFTESMVNDLDCGDKDSVGLFQQRPSQNWGTVGQIMDPHYSINAFLNALYPIAKSHPGTPPGTLAQMTQLAEAGDQYTHNIDTARQLIRDAAASVGDNTPAPPKNTPAPPKPKPSPPPSSGNDDGNGSTNVGSKPGSGNGGDDNSTGNDGNNDDGDDSDCDDDDNSGDDDECDPSDSGDDSSDNSGSNDSGSENTSSGPPSSGTPSTSTPSQFTCTKTYQPKAGDNCYFLTGKFGIKLSDVYAWNSNIDSECLNLQIGADYCVGIAQ